jgi:hypothetical protein
MRPLLVLLLLSSATGGLTNLERDSKSISRSGPDFLQFCKHAEDDPYEPQYAVDASVCVGFVEGFVQGTYVTENFHNTPFENRMTCPPDGVTLVQFIRIVQKYIQEHPERAHLETRYLASEALIWAFPCNTTK